MWRTRGDASTLAGLLEVAAVNDWDVIPAVGMTGGAGGLVDDAVVEEFWRGFDSAAGRALTKSVDGVCLFLHGAMVSQSYPDVEGELLRRIRSIVGLERVPICGVLDLHGNITELMARHSDGLVAYRCNPHTDGKAAAMDGARMLDRLMRGGTRAVTVIERPPLLLPPTATGTADDPMRALEAMARDAERRHPDILAVNVFAGFAYSDVPDAGLSFTANTIGDPDVARAELRRMCDAAMAMKQHADPTGISLDEAMIRLKDQRDGPVLLVEPADNIGGGAPGDLTIVLRALIEHGVQNAGAVIADAGSVRIASTHRTGERFRLSVGGKSGAIGAEPIDLQVELASTSDGRFTCEDPHSHMAVGGLQASMGPCAVVRSGAAVILLTSVATPPFDLAQWRSQGFAPERFFAINVKAAVAHRQAYDPIAKASYTLNTPGPCAQDLRRIPYQRIRRPIYPLDPLEVS